jgi:membrane-bound serine protease (ClpP class)
MTRAPAVLLGLLLLVQVASLRAQDSPAGRPLAIVAEIDGIIHPVSAEFLSGVIDQADAAGAEVVVFVLRTPGGLLDSTRSMVSRMITSRAPVAVLVAPSGARAASAGFVLLIAADVAAMAPGTHAGAAHPVSGTSQTLDQTTSEKAASDAAAYVRTLAEARGRNVDLSAEAVLKSRAFTDREALGASPPLIDLVARDVDDLLRQLDGRTIARFDGRRTTLETRNAETRRVEMTRRQQFLSAIAHPQVAYLLLTLGMLGLTVEIWNPGAIVPGVAGGVCLLLAFFAFQILPVNAAGLLLIVFGIGLLLLELKVPSFGALGIGGAASLLVGSVMVTDVVPGLSGNLQLIVPAALGMAALFLFLGRLAFKVRRQPPVTGIEALVGQTGRARTPLVPDAGGQIDLRGEIWNAMATQPVAPGEQVRVLEVNGLTVVVEPAGESARGEAAAGRGRS